MYYYLHYFEIQLSENEIFCLHYSFGMHFKNLLQWASLVAQWLGVCLLVRGTRVRALVWEDPTCRGAAGPVSHNY